MMDIRPIRTAEDHAWALSEIDALMNAGAARETPDGDRLDVLVDLVVSYEDRHFPIDPLDPVDFLRAHMKNTGRCQTDLAAVFGSAPRASEVLGRKRALTIGMIRRLQEAWSIPADVLIAPYRLEVA